MISRKYIKKSKKKSAVRKYIKKSRKGSVPHKKSNKYSSSVKYIKNKKTKHLSKIISGAGGSDTSSVNDKINMLIKQLEFGMNSDNIIHMLEIKINVTKAELQNKNINNKVKLENLISDSKKKLIENGQEKSYVYETLNELFPGAIHSV